MTELQKRVGISLIFIPLLLAALWFSGIFLILLFLLITLLGGFEYIAMMRSASIRIGWHWLLCNAVIYLGLVYLRGWDIMFVWLLFLRLQVEYLITWKKEQSFLNMLATLYGVVYTALLPALVVRLGLDYSKQFILFALLVMIWIVDSAAYFVGLGFGKRRNITAVSPSKSLEGFIAGMLVPALIVVILYFSDFEYISLPHLVLIAVAAGIFGQLGDLAESMLKRFCNVKDSSNLIPGHGGILDRVDSILIAGSFLYVSMEIINRLSVH